MRIQLKLNIEPSSVTQAMKNPNWVSAMKQEYDALIHNTYHLVSLTPDRRALGCEWVFQVKENVDGTVNKYKARLVAKGFNQVQGCQDMLGKLVVISNTILKIEIYLQLIYGHMQYMVELRNLRA